MTHAEGATHEAPHAAATSPVFTAEEEATFRNDDKLAAKNIVVLMVSIFTLGLVLYLVICLMIVS
jgi:hypothetical protein